MQEKVLASPPAPNKVKNSLYLSKAKNRLPQTK